LLLFNISSYNPFTYIVEAIRFSLYGKFDENTFLILGISFIITLLMAFLGFKSKKVSHG
jgi:ABC-2 type transport system permease protein